MKSEEQIVGPEVSSKISEAVDESQEMPPNLAPEDQKLENGATPTWFANRVANTVSPLEARPKHRARYSKILS